MPRQKGSTNPKADEIRRMLLEGGSYSMIANCLGVTRNVIAGMKWRLGLTVNKPAKPTVTRVRKPIAPQPSAIEPFKLPLANPTIPSNSPPPPGVAANPIGILQLKLDTCRWPIGEPRDADFAYCGDPVFFSSTGRRLIYCMHHAQLAFTPTHCRALGLPDRPEPVAELVTVA